MPMPNCCNAAQRNATQRSNFRRSPFCLLRVTLGAQSHADWDYGELARSQAIHHSPSAIRNPQSSSTTEPWPSTIHGTCAKVSSTMDPQRDVALFCSDDASIDVLRLSWAAGGISLMDPLPRWRHVDITPYAHAGGPWNFTLAWTRGTEPAETVAGRLLLSSLHMANRRCAPVKRVLEDVTIISSIASSMSLPIERLSQLSLESMSTSRRSQSRRREEDSAETTYESDIDTSIDFDETIGIATFPSGMRYSVHGLDPGTRDAVAQALNTPSKLALRGCSPREQDYVFLISETIEYHVRAPYGGSGPYDGPSCSCRQDERPVGLQHPCRHTLWLCDQLLSQLVPLPSDPYTWRLDGYTTEHGNVCDFIPDFQFDVLADSLRCDIMAGESLKPRPHRIQTAREILATLSGNSIETYRPDLTGEIVRKRVVKEGDLEETIFRMLLENDSLLEYFLNSMRNYEPLNPRFRRFRDRANAALEAFDDYIKASDPKRAELLKNLQWCCKTFKDISEQIRFILIHSEKELDDFDRRAAASTLVYILDQVISRSEDDDAIQNRDDSDSHSGGQINDARTTNIFNELIVEPSHNFILDVLDELQPKYVGHLLPELSRIEQAIAHTNVPGSYLGKLSEIISRLRDIGSSSSSEPADNSRKRASQDNDRYPKRVK
ncbi:hypothetical protein F4859DRAFT_511062 [Xylaria cf. heliscus]|nr:hypothetical protein F4859DRAFT_511062 [Xylaria cf. heliscus]